MKCAVFLVSTICFIGSIDASLRPRIIGGEDAKIRDFPYQASFRYQDKHFCGGTIISQQHILTAAHCFRSRLASPPFVDITVHTGIASPREIGHLHRIAKVKVYPGWVSKHPHDIAVVKLVGQISFDERQQKAELPIHDVVSGATGNLTGWGSPSKSSNLELSAQLQTLKMTLLSKNDCQSRLPIALYEDEFCAYHSKGHGFSKGDSGGPLVVNNQVFGVISWVHKGNYGSGLPDVCTNVYAHRNFIRCALHE